MLSIATKHMGNPSLVCRQEERLEMIEDYSFGRIVIDGREYTSDVVIHPDYIDDCWWRQEGHRLQLADLEEILAASPEVLVVGTGANDLMRIAPEVEQTMAQTGVELIALSTEQACRRYNELQDQKRTIAALHLTC